MEGHHDTGGPTRERHRTDTDLDELIGRLTQALDESGVAPEITAALAVVIHTVGRDTGQGAEAGRGAEASSPQDGARAHTDTIEAAQALHGWLDSVAVGATSRLYSAMWERCRPPGPEEELSTTKRRRWRRDARKATQTEIEVATGRGRGATRQLLDLATAPAQAREALTTSLANGAADAYRAWRVAEATDLFPAADRATIADAVLPRRPDGTRRSQQSFTKALQRAVTRHLSAAPELARQRDQKALDARDSTARVQDDGTGQIRTSGSIERIVAAHTRIDAIARAAKRLGNEPRTLAQLRSDVALDLIQFGTIAPVVDESGDATGSGGECGGAEGRRRPSVRYRELGELPPARVDIVVSLETLLGHCNGVGDLPGWSTITALRAREAALASGSVWARLVTDELGHLVEKSTDSYAPTPQIRTQTTARDGTCRFPGCQRPACRCQLDHITPWAPDGTGGRTRCSELQSLCEFHHDAKTRALWSALLQENGDVLWTSPTGHTYATLPQDWGAATAAADDGSDGRYRWFRDQLDRLLHGDEYELDPVDIPLAWTI